MESPAGLVVFAFRPLSGKQKILKKLYVLSVSAVSKNINRPPFKGFIKPTFCNDSVYKWVSGVFPALHAVCKDFRVGKPLFRVFVCLTGSTGLLFSPTIENDLLIL